MDTTETKQTIPTPLPLLMRRVRYQIVPILTLLVCLILSSWLWVRRGGSVTAIGSVNAIQLPVNAKIDGLLVNLPADRKIQIFDSVSAGEVVARLDSSHIQAQIERETDRLNEVRRQIEMINKIKPKNPTTAPTTATPPLPADEAAVAARLKGSARAAIVKAEMAETDADSEILNSPLLQNKLSLEMMANSYQAKIQELEQRILAQDIKAPISGTIISIHRVPGQAVTAGQAIMTIASEKGDYIVTYVRQTQVIQPKEGMTVNVHLRSAPRTLRSHVASVGPQVEKIPPEHLRDSRILEWGLPVHVAIPPDTKLRPGELVDLFFRPNDVGGI
ncbi:MAG TPA: HlyD family efflux transporter periplasmic adaptor subunit [Tepidisphaeraceae bacterium]|nr:HlyD family efflux transporter periplasmic adaptor subunit [Tepidisphaeraceae bacterium]